MKERKQNKKIHKISQFSAEVQRKFKKYFFAFVSNQKTTQFLRKEFSNTNKMKKKMKIKNTFEVQ